MKPERLERLIQIATEHHITLSLQRRTCGYTSCSTCHSGKGHGPYWYGYYRDGTGKLHGTYVGKVVPPELLQAIRF